MIPEIWSTAYNFLSFWTVFCPFTPYGPRKSKFLKYKKKTTRKYHLTNVYHKWQLYDVLFLRYGVQRTEIFVIHHMMYGSWDMEHDRQNFFSFWTNFCPFTHLITWKIKILKKWKKHLEILAFYTYLPKMTIIWCMVPEILSATDRIFCHFGPFFALLPP